MLGVIHLFVSLVITPSHANHLLLKFPGKITKLETIMLVGEAFTEELTKRIVSDVGVKRIVNGYG